MTDKVYSLNEIQNSLVPILRKYGVSQAWVCLLYTSPSPRDCS